MHTYLNGARLVLFLDQDPLSPRPGGMVRTVMRALSGPGVGDPARYPGLDNFISTNTVSAIEVYPRPLNVPPQYQHLNRDCGVILIWTK